MSELNTFRIGFAATKLPLLRDDRHASVASTDESK